MKTHQSKKLFLRSQKFLPLSISNPLKSFRTVGGIPRFIRSSYGCKMKDVDRNEYIDYCLCFGSLILGHSHPQIVKLLKKAVEDGINYGTTTDHEIELAEAITKVIPSMEMLKVVNSHTEAIIYSIRIAHAYTKRKKIIKFEGCYHGESDIVLVKPSSSTISVGVPEVLGVSPEVAKNTIVLPFNDVEILRKVVRENYRTISAIIVNPLPTNMGLVIPEKEFIEEIYLLTRKFGIILIFDESLSAFRTRYGAQQDAFNIKADITCLGKTLGCGFPLGIVGGKRELMEALHLSPSVDSDVSLSNNSIVMQIAYEVLKILQDEKLYTKLEEKTSYLCQEIAQQAKDLNVKVWINQVGSAFTVFFTPSKVYDLSSARQSDARKYAVFFHGLLNQNVYFPPSQFESAFLSLSHTDKDIEKTLEVTYKSLKEIKKRTT